MLILKNKGLTAKEKEFCRCFILTGDVSGSALNAGYITNPEVWGQKLIFRDDIVSEIIRLASIRRKLLSILAESGYMRLAFGDISDAVSLVFSANDNISTLKDSDLFMISEIKKPKDGALEIKFWDRLSALEKLNLFSDDDGAKEFFDAISQGAKALESEENEV